MGHLSHLEAMDKLVDLNPKTLAEELERRRETPLPIFLHGRVADEALRGRRDKRLARLQDPEDGRGDGDASR